MSAEPRVHRVALEPIGTVAALVTEEAAEEMAESYRRAGWRLATPGVRSPIVTPGARFLLGLPAFLLPTQTDEYFAWTIAVPLTAVFIGASFFSGALLALLASRRLLWAQARVSMVPPLVFGPLVTAATFIHLDLFHTDTAFGIIWVIAYAIYPALLAWVMYRQLREPGGDPPRGEPLANWVRALLAIHALILIPVGIAMFVLPGEFVAAGGLAGLWPWPLTELTSQVCGAFVLAFGAFVGAMLWENDQNRVWPFMTGYAGLGALQAIAVARYSGDMDWDSLAAYLFVVVIASTFAVAAYGWLVARRAPEPEGPPAAPSDGVAAA